MINYELSGHRKLMGLKSGNNRNAEKEKRDKKTIKDVNDQIQATLSIIVS